MKAFRKSDRQRAADGLACVHAVGIEERRDVRFDAAQLCVKKRAATEKNNSAEDTRPHFTSLSGIIATGAGGSDDNSTVPLTGGRSWNMKSHFQRSDGLLASSQ